MFLLAALIIIAILLALATIVNIGAQTDREQAQGVHDYTGDTLNQLYELERNLNDLTRHVNHEPDLQSPGQRQNALTSHLDDFETYMQQHYLNESKDLSLDFDASNIEEGVRIWTPSYENLTVFDEEDDEHVNSYTLFENIDSTRSFSLEIIEDHLATSSDEALTLTLEGDDDGDPFSTDFAIYESGGDLRVENSGGEYCESTFPSDGGATLSLTHGTLNSTYCEIIPATESLNEVSVENADNINASVDIVLKDDDGTITPNDNLPWAEEYKLGNPIEGGPSDYSETEEIEAHRAIFSVIVDVDIASPTGNTSTEMRIAPNLPHEVRD